MANITECLNEFTELFDDLTLSSGKLLHVGDLNFHLDDISNSEANKFLALLSATNHEHHLTEATHIGGHILDPVITRRGELPIRDIAYDHSIRSDHYAAIFTIPINAPPITKQTVNIRKWQNINTDAFCEDIKSSDILSALLNPSTGATDAFSTYNTTLEALLDNHAPVLKRTMTIRTGSPWFNAEIKLAKAKRRVLEDQWRKSKLTVHREMYTHQRDLTNELCDKAKKTYYHDKLSVRDQNQLYTVANNLLHRSKVKTLPTHSSANKFGNFFHDKVQLLHAALKTSPCPRPDMDTSRYITKGSGPINPRQELTMLTPATQKEVSNLLKKSAPKTCGLDPIPIQLLKKCSSVTIPVLTNIINKTLKEGMPTAMRVASVTPILKKPHLDAEVLKTIDQFQTSLPSRI